MMAVEWCVNDDTSVRLEKDGDYPVELHQADNMIILSPEDAYGLIRAIVAASISAGFGKPDLSDAGYSWNT